MLEKGQKAKYIFSPQFPGNEQAPDRYKRREQEATAWGGVGTRVGLASDPGYINGTGWNKGRSGLHLTSPDLALRGVLSSKARNRVHHPEQARVGQNRTNASRNVSAVRCQFVAGSPDGHNTAWRDDTFVRQRQTETVDDDKHGSHHALSAVSRPPPSGGNSRTKEQDFRVHCPTTLTTDTSQRLLSHAGYPFNPLCSRGCAKRAKSQGFRSKLREKLTSGIPGKPPTISNYHITSIGIEANTRGVPRVHVSVCRLTPTCTRYLLDKCFFWQTGAVNISVRKRRAERSRGRYPSLESRFPRGVAAAPAGGQVARRSTGVNANPRRYKRSINPPARVVMRGEIEGARDGEKSSERQESHSPHKVSAASCSSQLGSDGEVHTATKENNSPQP
ncbi:hypothetical protein Bbelb_423200 [Branchiostoma belcheri]|nr:hypothetical protein Bbelb_423200 [Branchiostoma belcheri]